MSFLLELDPCVSTSYLRATIVKKNVLDISFIRLILSEHASTFPWPFGVPFLQTHALLLYLSPWIPVGAPREGKNQTNLVQNQQATQLPGTATNIINLTPLWANPGGDSI